VSPSCIFMLAHADSGLPSSLAAEYGLDMTYIADFQQIFTDEKSVPAFADLLQRMKVITADGDTELTPDQWEAASESSSCLTVTLHF
jgi:hypothetical protein